MMTKLEKFSAKQCCLICKQNHVNELVYGAVYKLGQITVHYFCLLLSTDMVQRGKDEQGILGFLPEDIQSVVKKSSKMACTVCHRGGATVKCCSCTETFHLPCGIRHGTSHQFFGHFKSFCPKHCIQQKIPKDILVGIQHLMCSICLENAELDSVIWAPCCKKNGVFHRSCLQQMAYSFGSYTLKCPLCNDRKKFVKAIENNGIYIPQQDASWEVEPNAFLELLERYQHCDAKKCICPKGRKYTNSSNKSSTNWKIVLCEDCGSQGVHFKCLAAGSHFKCDVCKHVESAALQQKIETQSLPSHAIFMQDNGSSDNSPDQNSFSHSNCAGSVNGDHRNSNDITNTPFLKTRLRNSINSSTSRSKVCIHSNLSNSVESMNVDNVNTENVTNTKDSNLEMNVDEDNQSPRNYSNTSPTLKVEVCLNKFNHNSNKTTSDTAIQESSASISREKNNTSLELNNNSNNKRSANETIQKDLSSAQKRTLIETNGHDLPVKRRRDEKVASGPESISESPGIADISHQLTVELERFHGAKKKRMIVYADNHGKYLEGKLNRIQKYNVTVQIHEGPAENCLFSLENNLHHVDVSVILCGSHDVAQNQGERYISFLKKLVFSNSDSKFVIVDLPVRYDRPHWSFINRNIEKFNKILENFFEKCDNVRMVHVSETGRKHHTIYGRHLEYYGKIWLSRRICWAANEFLQ